MVLENIQVAEILNFLFLIFHSVSEVMQNLLEGTIFTAQPELASQYAEATTMLVALTGIWMVFEFVTSAKKILRGLLVLGWTLFIISLAISRGVSVT